MFYFTGNSEFDDFLIEVGCSDEISLVLIVEGDRIILIHGCLLLIS